MHACCIIKPDGLPHEEGILAALQCAAICVLDRKEVTYTDDLVEALYDHMDTDARDAIKEDLRGKMGIALLLSARSVAHILTVAGRESNPAKCAPESIRARFGIERPERRMGTWPWWDNVLHRPVDEREAKRDLQLVFGL